MLIRQQLSSPGERGYYDDFRSKSSIAPFLQNMYSILSCRWFVNQVSLQIHILLMPPTSNKIAHPKQFQFRARFYAAWHRFMRQHGDQIFPIPREIGASALPAYVALFAKMCDIGKIGRNISFSTLFVDFRPLSISLQARSYYVCHRCTANFNGSRQFTW